MELNNVLVIGAGTMGRSIAQWFCQQKVNVCLCDKKSEQLKSAETLINQSWNKLASKGKFSEDDVKHFNSLISYSLLEEKKKSFDLVIEAIFEDFEIKTNLFSQLDKDLNKDCIFASNTSSFPIASLSEHLPDERKKRFLGLHFFNPATIMKLVEVIPSKWTDTSIVTTVYDWFEKHNKKPARCSDSPGFIVNRVARNFYGEALRIAQTDDIERFKIIDQILKEVGGFKMGPFELMDLIGVDINYNVTQSVWKEFSHEPRFAPHPLQKSLVDSNRLGKKTKRGFYSYE